MEIALDSVQPLNKCPFCDADLENFYTTNEGELMYIDRCENEDGEDEEIIMPTFFTDKGLFCLKPSEHPLIDEFVLRHEYRPGFYPKLLGC